MTTKNQPTPEQISLLEQKLELASRQLIELNRRLQYLERENARRKNDIRDVASMASRK